jgi:cytochrome c oxidase subunit 2
MNELFRALLFLPPQASTVAREIDTLHYFVISATMLGVLLITGIGGYWLLRYRRRQSSEPPSYRTREALKDVLPRWLEVVLITGLLGLFVLFWFVGYRQYVRLRVPPPNSLDVYVVAKQWMWYFTYPHGGSNAILYVPTHQPVRLLMTSRDVIHSFYVPQFRIKQDVLPGRYTTVWFEVEQPGTYDIFCTEYCGTGHSTMRGRVIALSPEDYERFVEQGEQIARGESRSPRRYLRPATLGQLASEARLAPEARQVSLVEQGLTVSAERGCFRCHTTDGTPHIGPTWLGLYRDRVPLEGGQSVIADEGYITESMMDPLAKLHVGFPPVMPTYFGQIAPADTAAIVELIKSLRTVDTRPAQRPDENFVSGERPSGGSASPPLPRATRPVDEKP